MNQDFLLPDLGEGLPEADLIQWYVNEGDTVAVNQPLAEVETAKAVVDLPSPFAGVIRRLHGAAGETIEVGSVLVSFGDGVETASAGEPTAMPDAPSAGGDAAGDDDEEEVVPPNLVGYGAAPTSRKRPARKGRAWADDAPAASAGDAVTDIEEAPVVADAPVQPDRPRSTPPVRALAKELGVDIASIVGTGPDGLVVREDVRWAAAGATRGSDASGAASAPTPTTAVGRREERRTPIRGVRKHTAAAMVQSAFTAPHVTVFHTVDVTETTELIARLRAEGTAEPVGLLALVAKAVCRAIRRQPTLNSRWDEAAGEIIEFDAVHLGIAAATPRGLVVPVIRDADLLDVAGLHRAIRGLAQTARDGKTAPADMSGGTFSISNIGVFGVEAGTPILNPGEAGILALGAVQRRPWEYRGEIALREVMTLSLSFDHRLVDGEQGARFLREVADLLQDPARAMLQL